MKGETTLLGDDIKFQGKLQLNDSLIINGEFKGTINAASDLTVGPTAKVNADIEAVELYVSGIIQGNIFASKKLELRKHSQLNGDVRTPALQIDLGARLSGNCIMD